MAEKCCHPWVFHLSPVLIHVPSSDGTLGLGFVAKSWASLSPPRLYFCRQLVLIPPQGLQLCLSQGRCVMAHGIYGPSRDASESLLLFPPKPRYFLTRGNILVLPRMVIKSNRSHTSLFSTGPQGIAMFLLSSSQVVVYLLCAFADAPTPPRLLSSPLGSP